MPKTTVEKLTPTRAKLSVTVSPSELQPYVGVAYKTISEQISVPGFRKGKVPAPIIDQRVGREAVIQEAVNASLDDFYKSALAESDEFPLGRPTADVEKWPDSGDAESELVLLFEVEVRPDFTLPDYSAMRITVDDAVVGDDAVEGELTKLRERFGTLVTVDRQAQKGDFVELDLVAHIDGKEVDKAKGVSYEVGAGNLLEGIDDAVETLTAGEVTTFTSQLLGGEFEGQDAEVELTVTAVKERELPEVDDDFAQLASEYDTLAELRESLKEQVDRTAVFAQGEQARDLFIDQLIEQAHIPLSEEVIEGNVQDHLKNEGRLDDDMHSDEVRKSAEKQFQMQLLLDAIVKAEQVNPTQHELSQYIYHSAQQYGMNPNEFLQAISQGDSLQMILLEVTRNKALSIALGKTTVIDKSGHPVDMSEFTRVDTEADTEAQTEGDATVEPENNVEAENHTDTQTES